MLALIPLLIQFIPDIARWIEGDAAGNVAQKVADVAQSVLGTTDPAAAATLLADQSKVSDLRIALAKIGADVERAKLDAQTAAITAALADTANARQQTVDLAKSGSSIAWGAPVVSIICLGLFGYGMWVVFHAVPGDTTQAQTGIIEALKQLPIAVVMYWLGSSRSSQSKDEMIYNSMPVQQGATATRPLA